MHIHTMSRLAATALVFASCGFGAVFAWNTGIPQGYTLGALSVLFAVALELLKPLAVSAAISAACSWQFIRSALLGTLALVAVAYSLTAELSLMAGSRSDYVSSRHHVVTSAARSSERYTSAKEELAALAPSRLLAEIEADKLKTRNEVRLAKLDGEAARAKRRNELQAVLGASVEPTFGSADPGTSALALYLSYIGYTIPTDELAQWLYLLPVLALEIGSALGMVLVNTVAAKPADVMNRQQSSMVHGEPNPLPTTLEVGAPPHRMFSRDEAAKRLVNHLLSHGGSLLHSERDLAKLIGADRNTTRRAVRGLADAKLITYVPSKKGTVVKLLV